MSRGKIVGGRIRRKFPRRTFCFRIDLIEALDRNEIFEISSCAYLDRDLLLKRSRSGEREGKTVRFLRVATVYIYGHPFRRRSGRGESTRLSGREKLWSTKRSSKRKSLLDRVDNYSIMNSVRQCCPSIIGNNRHVVRVDAS